MSNPFNLTSHHKNDKAKKEQMSIPFDAPDVIAPTKFTNSQNSLRRRTMTGVDMINSQNSGREKLNELKRQHDDSQPLLDSARYKDTRPYNYSQGLPLDSIPARDNIYSSQQHYRQHPRNEFNMYDTQLSHAELLEKNYMLQTRLEAMMSRYKELSDLRHTEAEEIGKRFKMNEGYRDEAYAYIEKAVQELQVLKSSGDDGQKQLVERLQIENQSLKEQLREHLKSRERITNNPDTASSKLVLYERLTDVKVLKIKNDFDGELYECSISGVATHKFTLFVPKEPEKLVQYTPVNENNQILVDILPDFLLEDIDFSRDNLPIFFWRLSAAIHTKK